MWEDPIVAEVHRAREKLAAECNFDIFVIKAGPEASPRGHVLFEAMVKHFGTCALGIVGSL